jgi:2-oxoglutarate ferredoxin oxidoreductase subunit alpha
MKRDICVGFVGAGGAGVVSCGEMLIQAAANEGLSAMATMSFGPQIRGGESSSKLRIADHTIYTPGDFLDVLVAFHLGEYPKFKAELELKDDAVVILEQNDALSENPPIPLKPGMRVVRVPFQKLAKEEAKNPLAVNIVALGLVCELFGLPYEGLVKIITRKFTKKGDAVVQANLKALEIGRAYGRDTLTDKTGIGALAYTRKDPCLVMTGNDAVALGTIYGGCDFFAGYPITPSSEVMHQLSEFLPLFGARMLQVEDEISAICHCIGASFAGAKALTVTSGPGLSLMQEGIGLASISEIPLVIVDVQRGGPSTGLPTKSEQGDLLPAVFGTHGDAPKIVIAPADVQDCFDTTIEAIYAAEHYQMPVIVLSDQYLGHRFESIPRKVFHKVEHTATARLLPAPEDLIDYIRYKDTPSGISPMAIPGTPGGMHLASGITHDERGDPSSNFEVHERTIVKRFRKFNEVRKELQYIRHYGPEDAKVGAVAWGSTKGAVREAVERLNAEGAKVKAVVPQIIYPPNYGQFDAYVQPMEKFVVFESSWNQQFSKFIKTYYQPGKQQIHSYAHAGGRALRAQEIYDSLKEVCK